MTQETVSHSRCKRCDTVKHVAELVESSEGVGKVCRDQVVCRTNQEESKQAVANGPMKPISHGIQSPGNDV